MTQLSSFRKAFRVRKFIFVEDHMTRNIDSTITMRAYQDRSETSSGVAIIADA